MATTSASDAKRLNQNSGVSVPLADYGCDGTRFAGVESGLYDRHLFFDKIVAAADANARDRFEAFAHAVRDVLSQRWVITEQTYSRQNAKRVPPNPGPSTDRRQDSEPGSAAPAGYTTAR